MSIVSHLSVGATTESLPLMIDFYDAIMKELGAKRKMVIGSDMKDIDLQTFPSINDKGECNILAVAYGKCYPEFWVQLPENQQEATPGNGYHVAFQCKSPAQVQRVYETALQHGATDNGKPGPRPHYSDKYYGAFFIDPCGNKLEAVFFDMGIYNHCVVL
ncbi:hypothetical protein FisN_6Hh089 [Fistulifera solaris]|jgi:catechol 2,3-dioxygenase-like lactoylglutathione lyase family enzyme|uniref:VOC domain-containing protein n=1 Tax=Fistulifera solaris TaxID=1519565 RepID=A0A1Z5KHT6_FISSO|nr:hypothetical protein FisN_6Hh089 [Fistulifera solaris]|eukprot:GAX25873.1 hypothetical protein FisN_6Hh089 [Fistulifera solaris]